jgi:hypothetical protein
MGYQLPIYKQVMNHNQSASQLVSEENLGFMRKVGARYLVGTPKVLLKKFEQNWESGLS